jgi:hypothetical protein
LWVKANTPDPDPSKTLMYGSASVRQQSVHNRQTRVITRRRCRVYPGQHTTVVLTDIDTSEPRHLAGTFSFGQTNHGLAYYALRICFPDTHGVWVVPFTLWPIPKRQVDANLLGTLSRRYALR